MRFIEIDTLSIHRSRVGRRSYGLGSSAAATDGTDRARCSAKTWPTADDLRQLCAQGARRAFQGGSRQRYRRRGELLWRPGTHSTERDSSALQGPLRTGRTIFALSRVFFSGQSGEYTGEAIDQGIVKSGIPDVGMGFAWPRLTVVARANETALVIETGDARTHPQAALGAFRDGLRGI